MTDTPSAPVAAPATYHFRAMTTADLGLVGRWLAEPHVARWWPDGEGQARSIADHLSEPSMRCLILTMGETDVGYLQVHDPHHQPCLAPDGQAIAHPYRDQPHGARGIDLFIGDARFVGRSHGPRLIDCVLRQLFQEGSPCVVTDPDPANTQSVAAFRKAGFRPLETRDTAWGHVLLMRRDNPNQATTP